jgi:hypothetical protein
MCFRSPFCGRARRACEEIAEGRRLSHPLVPAEAGTQFWRHLTKRTGFPLCAGMSGWGDSLTSARRAATIKRPSGIYRGPDGLADVVPTRLSVPSLRSLTQ